MNIQLSSIKTFLPLSAITARPNRLLIFNHFIVDPLERIVWRNLNLGNKHTFFINLQFFCGAIYLFLISLVVDKFLAVIL
jgi:hypothetical protein